MYENDNFLHVQFEIAIYTVYSTCKFVSIPEDYFHLFLHSCYGDLEVTKKTIEAYFTVRTHAPDLFSQKDPLLPEIQNVLDIA